MSTAASLDVSSIVTYAATERGIPAAIAADDTIDAKLRALDRLAQRGRIVPELRRRGIAAYRELIASPYRIIYRIVRSEVWVVAVVDGRRDTEELLHERALRDGFDE